MSQGAQIWCSVTTSGVGWGGRFKREGTSVYLWLVHANVWQKPTQCWKAVILQLKIKADAWIRKLWYIYTMEYYSAIKKKFI